MKTHINMNDAPYVPMTSVTVKISPPVTPDQPRRELSKVLERLARAICARHNDCSPTDGYTNKRWPDFLPGAKAAYDELIKIDAER